MKKNRYKLLGLTMAITNMQSMLNFYESLFKIDFEEKNNNGILSYEGFWGQYKLLFCPADNAGTADKPNNHQIDIVVQDLDEIIRVAKLNGGEIINEIVDDDFTKQIKIYDPDRNRMFFRQYK